MNAARAVSGVLLAALLLLGLAGVAHAHADILRSEPATDSVLQSAPEQVRVWFTEPLDPGFSEVQVIDANRQRVDRGDSHVSPDDPTLIVVSLQPLDRGTYTVTWQSLSAVDGHVTRGVFSLSIGVEPAATPVVTAPSEVTSYLPIEAAIRWLGYLAAATIIGVLLFRLLILEPVAQRQGLANALLSAVAPPFHRLLRVGWIGLLLTTLAALVLQVADVSGDGLEGILSSAPGQLLFSSRYGTVWLARLGLILTLGAALVWLSRRPLGPYWWLGAVLGGAIPFTTTLNSHSAAVSDLTALAVLADWLHLIALSVWIGGLFSFVFVLPSGLASRPSAERSRLLATIIPRFSVLASASVGTLIVTGLYLAWLHVGSFGALLETLYGTSLLVKLGFVVLLLLLGAINLFIISPRLTAAVANVGNRNLASALSDSFRRVVRGEAVIAGLVLLAAGVLTSLPPGHQTYAQILAARPFELRTQTRNLALTLAIAPARPGPNTFVLTIRDLNGQPIADAERVDLRFTYLDQDLGTSIETAAPQEAGRYAVRAAAVGVEGRWQAEVLVRRPGQDDVRTAFRFVVTPTSAMDERPGAQASGGLRLPTLDSSSLVSLGLILIGVGLVVYVARTVGVRSLEGGALALASLAVIGLGIYLTLRVQPVGPTAPSVARAMSNPVAPTEESLQIGEQIYRAQCQTCHGANGRGDGPAAVSLNPRPADFRVHMAAGHTDGELFYWVSDGMSGTAMPAFGNQLSEDERWHVVNFIKTFAPVDR